MNEKFDNLKLRYNEYKKGNENPYAIKTEALSILREAKEKGFDKIIDDVEEILIDIELSINENKCNCNRSCC